MSITNSLFTIAKQLPKKVLLYLFVRPFWPLSKEYLQALSSDPDRLGTVRYCNICGYRFSKFNICNHRNPREAECPICKSRERHRHLYIHICSLFPFLKDKKILHFAPEHVIKKILLQSDAEYYDADINPEKARYKIDITNIEFNDNYFDYIFCFHVLEHIPDDKKAIKELYRVLKPGGTAYLAVPLGSKFLEDLSITDPQERLRLYLQEDHVRLYNIATLTKRLEDIGFTVVLSRPNKFPSELDSAMLGNIIFIARKS